MPAVFSALMNHVDTSHAELEDVLGDNLEDDDLEAAELDQEEEMDGLLNELEVDALAAKKAFRKQPDELNTIDLADLVNALERASEDIIVGKTAHDYKVYVDELLMIIVDLLTSLILSQHLEQLCCILHEECLLSVTGGPTV